jgi:hypothetical protein
VTSEQCQCRAVRPDTMQQYDFVDAGQLLGARCPHTDAGFAELFCRHLAGRIG